MDLIESPVISVIITTYNHEKYIAQAIESVLMQKDCPNFEIIIGEDCSTDGTLKIIEQYAYDNPKIRILKHSKNLGMQKNLKKCIDNCKGRYIAICEGDDYWIDEHKLKMQYEALEKYTGAVMCFSDINLLFEDGTTTEHFMNKHEILPAIITAKEIILYNGSSATFSCCMYLRQALEAIPQTFYEGKENYDLLFNLYVLESGFCIFLKKVCTIYRINSNGLWNRKSDKEKRNESVLAMSLYNKLFDYKYDEYFNEIILQFMGQKIEHKTKTKDFRELAAIKIPCPGKRLLKISIQGMRKGE